MNLDNACQHERKCDEVNEISTLILFLRCVSAHLLCLQVLIEKVKCGLVGLGTAHDCEHSLSSLVVWRFSDANARTRSLANLADFATGSADDTSHHVRRNANILGLELLSILIMCWRATLSGIRIRSAVVVAGCTFAEIGSIASSHNAWAIVLAGSITSSHASLAHSSYRTRLCANNRIIEDGASTALPIINQTLANLPDGLLDAFGAALNLNNTLSGLGKHLLLRDHANTRDILDMLDLETLSANDRAHLVVRDQ